MLATAGADRSDFDSKFIRPHDAHACRVSAARDQQRARKSFVSSNQFDFNIIIGEVLVVVKIGLPINSYHLKCSKKLQAYSQYGDDPELSQ